MFMVKYFPLMIVILTIFLSALVYLSEPNRVLVWILMPLSSIVIFKESKIFIANINNPYWNNQSEL